MNPRILAAYRFFRAHAGGWVGHSAETAIWLARAEERARDLGLRVEWEDEREEWDGDCEAPPILVSGLVRTRAGEPLASLGMVGLLSWRDPYVRVVEAEILSDALATLDAWREEETTRGAEELLARATYAGGGA